MEHIGLTGLRALASAKALKKAVLKAQGDGWLVIVNDDLLLQSQQQERAQVAAGRVFSRADTALDLLHSVGCKTVVVDMTDKTTSD